MDAKEFAFQLWQFSDSRPITLIRGWFSDRVDSGSGEVLFLQLKFFLRSRGRLRSIIVFHHPASHYHPVRALVLFSLIANCYLPIAFSKPSSSIGIQPRFY